MEARDPKTGACTKGGGLGRGARPFLMWRGAEGSFRMLAPAIAMIVLFASPSLSQPLSAGGGIYVTYCSGDDVILAAAPGSGTGLEPSAGSGNGCGALNYSLSEIPQPAWYEGFDSGPQGVSAAEWAPANGYHWAGNSPSYPYAWLNVTEGDLKWSNTQAIRATAVYNFTLRKELGSPCDAYNFSITVGFWRQATLNMHYAPLYLTVTGYDENNFTIFRISLYQNVSLFGGVSACGGSPAQLAPVYNRTSTIVVASEGYGQQTSVFQDGATILNFTAYSQLNMLSINYFTNETTLGATASPDLDYNLTVSSIALSVPTPNAGSARLALPPGDWRWVQINGSATSWSLCEGGTVKVATPVFNGEFSLPTTGGWVGQGCSTFSASGGSLQTQASGSGLGGSGLGQPAASYPGAFYQLPIPGSGDFYVAVRVSLTGWTTSLQYTSRVGIAVVDTEGKIVAYLSAGFNKPAYKNIPNLQDQYYGTSPNDVTGGTILLAGVSSLTVNISRAGSRWAISCAETGLEYTTLGTGSPIGGILLHHTNTLRAMTASWDYVRTNLPVEAAPGVLCGDLDLLASKSGVFYANTTLAYDLMQSGIPSLKVYSREDAGGLKFTGVAQGDVLTLLHSNGSVAFSATVPAGASELTVCGVAMPFDGTAFVSAKPHARALAQYTGALMTGGALALSCSGGAYSISPAQPGNWSGLLVSGLQYGWKVTAANGSTKLTFYANATGQILIPPSCIPSGDCTLSVFAPTACAAATLLPSKAYAAIQKLSLPALEGFATDVIFYEISTVSYTYRVEAKLLSVLPANATFYGSALNITFAFNSYENGEPAGERVPTLYACVGAGGSGGWEAYPVSRVAPQTFSVVLPTPMPMQSGSLIPMRILDPNSGITMRGSVLVP